MIRTFFQKSLNCQDNVDQTRLNSIFFSNKAAPWLVALLLALHFTMAMTSVLHKSSTHDEIHHIGAGYAYLQHNDFRYDPESGNLPKQWAALPLLAMDLQFPDMDKNSKNWDPLDEYLEFFYGLGNNTDLMLFCARAMIALLSVGLGLVVFFWSKNIFGKTGGLISLALYSFSPSILAHARLTTSDMAAALFFIAALYAVWRAMHRMTLLSVGLASIFAGFLALSKMSGAIILPVVGVLFLFRIFFGPGLEIGFFRPLKKMGAASGAAWIVGAGLAAAMLAVCVIWAFYGFRYQAAPLDAASWATPIVTVFQSPGPSGAALDFCQTHKLLPESFLLGCADTFGRLSLRDGFLNGRYSINGWWYFFPFTFAVKTPVSLFFILLAAMAFLAGKQAKKQRYKAVPLLVFAGIYLTFAMASDLNIGHRHILPVYPVIFILCGAVALFKKRQRAFVFFASMGCVAVFIVESLIAWPHYLSYFNTVAGGPSKGFHRLVDSSLDWGQDLPALSCWLKKNNQDNAPAWLSYFGTAKPAHFGIHAFILPPKNISGLELKPLGPGLYCISATYLQQLYTGVLGPWSMPFEQKYQELTAQIIEAASTGQDSSIPCYDSSELSKIIKKYKRARFARLCHVLRQREPDAMAGYSILIYNVDQAELRKALFEPMDGLPETRCVKGGGPYSLLGERAKNKN